MKLLYQMAAVGVLVVSTGLYVSLPGNAETSNLGPILVHVVNPISGEQILPRTFPLPGRPSTTIKIVASRGEYEPASFVIRPTVRDMENLRVSMSDLVSDSGMISGSHVDLRFVKVWFQGGEGGIPSVCLIWGRPKSWCRSFCSKMTAWFKPMKSRRPIFSG